MLTQQSRRECNTTRSHFVSCSGSISPPFPLPWWSHFTLCCSVPGHTCTRMQSNTVGDMHQVGLQTTNNSHLAGFPTLTSTLCSKCFSFGLNARVGQNYNHRIPCLGSAVRAQDQQVQAQMVNRLQFIGCRRSGSWSINHGYSGGSAKCYQISAWKGKKKIVIPSPVMGCPWTQHWLWVLVVVHNVHNWARCCTTVGGDTIRPKSQSLYYHQQPLGMKKRVK